MVEDLTAQFVIILCPVKGSQDDSVAAGRRISNSGRIDNQIKIRIQG
jgi:hypothetical protein